MKKLTTKGWRTQHQKYRKSNKKHWINSVHPQRKLSDIISDNLITFINLIISSFGIGPLSTNFSNFSKLSPQLSTARVTLIFADSVRRICDLKSFGFAVKSAAIRKLLSSKETHYNFGDLIKVEFCREFGSTQGWGYPNLQVKNLVILEGVAVNYQFWNF